MKRIYFLYILLVGLVLATSCREDNPKIIFHEHKSVYSIGGDRELDVTFNGVTLVDTPATVEITTSDGNIATITLIQIIPDKGRMEIGGVKLMEAPDHNGVIFEGEMAVGETEKIVFSGSIINFKLTIDIQTVPIE